MITKAQKIKNMNRMMKTMQKLDEQFAKDYLCSGVPCAECPFNMGDKKLHFHLTGAKTSCAYAAISSINAAVVANARKRAQP